MGPSPKTSALTPLARSHCTLYSSEMRFVLILLLCLPASAHAQARADSARHQNNFMSPQSQQARPQKRQTPHLQQWPQDQQRTKLFCDQYARAAGGETGRNTGSQTGNTFAKQTGYVATRDRKQARALGMVGGAVGSSAGAAIDQNFQEFHFNECMKGGRLITTRGR